jgi:saccharopine dehydrogenase (NAD+, L-lysine forming)
LGEPSRAPTHLWVRAEVRPTERRAPVVPYDVARLVAAGFRVTVEESTQRVFDIEAYAEAGATVVPTGSWVDAPDDVVVVGIKELPESPDALRHRHVYFAHAFKGQSDAVSVLERFRAGGGTLSDIEYLTDGRGRRVVAFGYWAGYVGAALGVLHLAGALDAPLEPMGQHDLDALLLSVADRVAGSRPVVTGARGRSGTGACDALGVAGLLPARWDQRESSDLGSQGLLAYDLLVNCVGIREPTPPFLSPEDLDAPRRLRAVSDVTCDVTSDKNMIRVNDAITTWDEPVRTVRGRSGAELDVIAIDNLPSLLPREASIGFSEELTVQLLGLADPSRPSGPWVAAEVAFRQALTTLP